MSPAAAAGRSVTVRVPATSANLGPGFDALGLALGVYDELSVTLLDAGLEVVPYGNVPLDERNLVVRSLRGAFAAVGEHPPGLRVAYSSHIPHSRGLGSSSAAICAGVVAALALHGVGPTDPLALQVAAEMEGHPDNVAPCLLGGATIAYYTGGVARAVRIEPAESLRPLVLVPSARTSTKESRSALPSTVPHRDAAFTAGRAALLVAALTSRPDLLLEATEDRLHQAFRLPAVPLSHQVFSELRAARIPAVLSGSGPTVLALCRSAAETEAADAIVSGLPDEGSGLAVHRPLVDRAGSVVRALNGVEPD